jgi:hypothetical protein
MRLLLPVPLLLLAACTPSLQPLYTPKDVVFDPALIGIWRDVKEAKNYIAVTRSEQGESYHLLQSDGNGTAGFTATLLKLGGLRFVDLYPDEPAAGTGFYKGHLVRAHTFGRIDLADGKLSIGLLDPDWFKTAEAKDSPVKLMIMDDDQPLLTQSTAALQSFAVRYAGTQAFGGASEWKREANSATSPR